MAYIPPHKRHLKDADRPPPVPDSLIPQFRKNVKLWPTSSSETHQEKCSFRGQKIVYANSCISRWWPVGSTDDDPIPESFHLECISCDPVERERGEKPLVLVEKKLPTEANKVVESPKGSPWVFVVERVQPNLLAALRNVKIELESSVEEFKPSFVARFGKIFFHGCSSSSLDIIKNAALAEATYRNKLNKSFYTHVPRAYVEEIEHLIVPKIGFDFDSEKEHYHVKVFDKSRPASTISCKCTIAEDRRKLQMYKDKDAIDTLIKAAVVDPDVKGGLRWPMGKECAGERFSIVGVWHTEYKAFRSPSMRLKLRHADRFDFRSSKGEVSDEVSLKLTAISRWLTEGGVDTGPVIQMLQEAAKLIWDHFLNCNHKLT